MITRNPYHECFIELAKSQSGCKMQSVNIKSGLVEMSAKLKTTEFAGKVMIKESKTKC